MVLEILRNHLLEVIFLTLATFMFLAFFKY
jgi:hypothetical protein